MVLGTHVCVAPYDSTSRGQVVAMAVHVVCSTERVTVQSDTEVLHTQWRFLKHLSTISPRTLLPLWLRHETPEVGLGHHKVGCEDVHLVQWWHFGVGKQCPTLYSQSVHEAFKAMHLHFPLIKMRQLSPALHLSFVTLHMWGNDVLLCSSGM